MTPALSPRQQLVLNALCHQESLSAAQALPYISHLLRSPCSDDAGDVLRALQGKGLAQRVSRGRYCPNQAGRDLAARPQPQHAPSASGSGSAPPTFRLSSEALRLKVGADSKNSGKAHPAISLTTPPPGNAYAPPGYSSTCSAARYRAAGRSNTACSASEEGLRLGRKLIIELQPSAQYATGESLDDRLMEHFERERRKVEALLTPDPHTPRSPKHSGHTPE